LKINYSNINTVVDSFLYDNNGNLVQFIEWQLDSTQSPIIRDSLVYTFRYPGNSNIPSSYSRLFFRFPTLSDTQYDSLIYDNQSRIIKDTLLNPTRITGLCVDDYLYAGNTTLVKQYAYQSSNTPPYHYNVSTDSMVINNGNLSTNTTYWGNYAVDSSGNTILLNPISSRNSSYTYSSFANPLYNPQRASSLGPLLQCNEIGDFISQNLILQGSDLQYAGATPNTFTFNWTGGPSGKTIQGTLINTSDHKLIETLTFQLK